MTEGALGAAAMLHGMSSTQLCSPTLVAILVLFASCLQACPDNDRGATEGYSYASRYALYNPLHAKIAGNHNFAGFPQDCTFSDRDCTGGRRFASHNMDAWDTTQAPASHNVDACVWQQPRCVLSGGVWSQGAHVLWLPIPSGLTQLAFCHRRVPPMSLLFALPVVCVPLLS